MAVVNLKSTIISNRDATPKVLTDNFVSQGPFRETTGFVLTGSADSVASVYRLCQVPSNARVNSLKLQNTAITGGAINIGVYWPTFVPAGAFLPGTSGAVISASLFGAAQSVATATTTPIEEITLTNLTLAQQELTLWQVAGLAADPGLPLDICAAVSAAPSVAGSISLKATYVV